MSSATATRPVSDSGLFSHLSLSASSQNSNTIGAIVVSSDNQSLRGADRDRSYPCPCGDGCRRILDCRLDPADQRPCRCRSRSKTVRPLPSSRCCCPWQSSSSSEDVAKQPPHATALGQCSDRRASCASCRCPPQLKQSPDRVFSCCMLLCSEFDVDIEGSVKFIL
jgi:hypothetical protein